MSRGEEETLMEMLLMGAVLSIFGIAVSCLAFAAATRPSGEPEQAPEPKKVKSERPARFFAPTIPPMPVGRPQVPIEALLLQIESHVRLEHAAAESFIEMPTASLLHSRTISPLIQQELP
jgi:hypothetical protein